VPDLTNETTTQFDAIVADEENSAPSQEVEKADPQASTQSVPICI
jgi:hypothetical protein